MLALSMRHPYAELILRGIKTVELRSRSTSIVGFCEANAANHPARIENRCARVEIRGARVKN